MGFFFFFFFPKISQTSLPTPTSCLGYIADIVFVVEESSGVSSSEFDVAKQFIKDLIDGVDVDADKRIVRIGLVSYSDDARERIALGDYTNATTLKTTCVVFFEKKKKIQFAIFYF